MLSIFINNFYKIQDIKVFAFYVLRVMDMYNYPQLFIHTICFVISLSKNLKINKGSE